jgi:hypothetical protein
MDRPGADGKLRVNINTLLVESDKIRRGNQSRPVHYADRALVETS